MCVTSLKKETPHEADQLSFRHRRVDVPGQQCTGTRGRFPKVIFLVLVGMGLGVPAHAQRTDSKLAPHITAFERYLVNAATPDQVPLFVSQHVSDGLIASKGVETV